MSVAITKNNNMNTSLDNLRINTGLNDCLTEIFSGTEKHALDLGFDYCAYHIRLPVPITKPAVAMLNNYPLAWSARYQEKAYLTMDPTVEYARHYQTSLLWSERVFAKAPKLWADMEAHGLTVGWAQPARDAKNIVGLLTFARSENPITPGEMRAKQPMFAWLAQTTHIAFSRQLAPQLMPAINAPLSAREVDILRWTAEGKTSGEISDILNISERTVNYHVNNATSKLGVANKTAATAHAALMGIL